MKKEQEQEQRLTQAKVIQKNITEGRMVVMKKEGATSFVRIRYNNTDTDGSERWRVIINGNEFQTKEIIINCPTRTLTEKFEDVGIKHHIVCDANEIVFKDNVATIN